MIYRFLAGLMRTIARGYLLGKLRIEGAEHIPAEGPVLLAGNHIATIDPPLTGAYVPRKDVFYMAKKEYFRRPLQRLLFQQYHAFPVSRGTGDRRALATAVALLRKGNALLMYPEGTRSSTASIRDPKAGVGYILQHAPATLVVPVAIMGSERVMKKHELFPKRQDVTIRFGTPFPAPLAADDGSPLTPHEISLIVMHHVAELLPDAYRGIYQEQGLDELLAHARERHRSAPREEHHGS